MQKYLDFDKVLKFLPDARAAMNKSKDLRTKVGAIILDPEYAIVASGWNGFPRGVDDKVEERYQPPLKYLWTVHAEMNAMANAARRGVPLKDCEVLIVNNIICARCCGPLLQAGVRAIYCANPDIYNLSHQRLLEEYAVALQMMHERNVNHLTY